MTTMIATAELADFLNTQSAARAEARYLTNAARRAETLLTTDGYTAEEWVCGIYFVTGPAGQSYTVTSDEVFGEDCTCPAFQTHGECKHHLAVAAQKDEAANLAAQEAEWERAEEARNFFGCRGDF